MMVCGVGQDHVEGHLIVALLGGAGQLHGSARTSSSTCSGWRSGVTGRA